MTLLRIKKYAKHTENLTSWRLLLKITPLVERILPKTEDVGISIISPYPGKVLVYHRQTHIC